MSKLPKQLIAKTIIYSEAGYSDETIAKMLEITIEEVEKHKYTKVEKGSDLAKLCQVELDKLKQQTFSVDKLTQDLVRQIKQSQDISNEVFQQMQNCLNVLKTSKDAAEIDRVATTVRALNHITTGTKNLSDMLEKVRSNPEVTKLISENHGELYFDSEETKAKRKLAKEQAANMDKWIDDMDDGLFKK